MTRRRQPRRTLREDERALWEQVASSTRPMRPSEMREMVAHAGEDPENARQSAEPETPEPIRPFRITGRSDGQGGSSITYAPPRLGDGQLHMDRKAFLRMKRGKLIPEDRIDLHGMTLKRAHGVLNGFIMGAYRRNLRLVLVITGKGKDRDPGGPIPQRRGVLRHQVPDWLRTAPLAPLVLQITEASRKHGGQGAYYVYLRRPR